jgi:predicted N-acyltransferase
MRRERKRVAEQNIELQLMHGNELTEKDWKQVTGFYLDTFNRKWGTPTLNAKFFAQIGKTMGDKVIVVFATHNEQRVACSVMLKGTDTLYGRYWGCTDDFHSLHFEACYYQGIDYCIKHGLKRFEPGAQGEHKIGRGFKPTLTWSTHYLCHEGFRDAVKQFLDQEGPMMREHCQKLHELLPFKQTDDKPVQ